MLRILTLLLLAAALPAADRPNIVFILCDDLGVNDLGCYNRHEHKTPNLDKLAAEGMRFTYAYAASPVCSPTRAAILTGKHPARLRLTNYLPGRGDCRAQKLLQAAMVPALPLEEITLAERLKSVGYVTACIGKWHLGHSPGQQGFDVVHPGKADTSPTATEGGKGEYDLTDKALDFITTNQDKPFFLYLAHNSPHIRLAAQRDLIDKYAQTFNPVYAAMIHTLDDAVGQVLAMLDRHKLTRKTIVIFTSDNGGLHVPEGREDCPTHNSPFRAGKGFLYEGGLRIPLLVRYPGTVPPATVSDTPLVSTDWTPTLLKLCGIATTDQFDGTDMSRALLGEKLPDRTLYWHYPHYSNQGGRPGGALFDGTLKYIEHYEDGRFELYNPIGDPGERHDQAEKLRSLAENYRDKFAEWKKSIAAAENRPNPDFDPAAHKAIYLDYDVSQVQFEITATKMAAPLRPWRERLDAAIKK